MNGQDHCHVEQCLDSGFGVSSGDMMLYHKVIVM